MSKQMSCILEKKHLKLQILLFCLLFFSSANAAPVSFSFHQLGQNTPIILIIGGIQGDEPGGFNAASILTTHYTFPDNNIWIVPNLNFPSIINKDRGIYGDMNRKFLTISNQDPEYQTVKKIQEIILDPAVALVINLHDGSGFYREEYISDQYQPGRWGQCLIIDKASMDNDGQFAQLDNLAKKVLEHSNKKIQNPDYKFTLNNTHTDNGNAEMSKTLSWYAVRNGKAAFGQEVSKFFDVPNRTYYHLLMLESFFEALNISYSRQFELTPQSIKQVIENDIYLSFLDNKILLPLDNIRPVQAGLIPMPKNAENDYMVNRPIVAASAKNNDITVYYGNNVLTKFKVERLEYGSNMAGVHGLVDGQELEVVFGDIVHVKDSFIIEKNPNYRVNAIGAEKSKAKPADESGIVLKRKDFQDRFSVDKAADMFRVEVYDNKKFLGMFIVDFSKNVNVNYPLAKQKITTLNNQMVDTAIKNVDHKNFAMQDKHTDSENLGR